MSYLNECLNDLAIDLDKNFSNINAGGCGIVAYYTAKYFKLKEILAIQSVGTNSEDFLKTILDKEPLFAIHFLVRTGRYTYFDADGVTRLFELKRSRDEMAFKLIKEKSITINFVHNEIYKKDGERLFYVLLKNHEPIRQAIQNPKVWNNEFDRGQIPGIKKKIKEHARSFFNGSPNTKKALSFTCLRVPP